MKRQESSCSGFVRGMVLTLLAMTLCSARAADAQPTAADFKTWGMETLDQIEKDFAFPTRGLYADTWKRGQEKPGGPVFMWGGGVQLSALAVAARLEPKRYSARLRQFITALDGYWTPGDNGIGGYDVLPVPKPLDRYYDDNLWVALALIEAFEVTHDTAYRDRAEAVFTFVLSGEDNKLDGGIYWREREKTSKNTCSNGPAVALALRLYQVTKKSSYLDIARRLYAWTNAHLQDTDGLYWDNIRLDGSVEKMKWSYNTALMLRANCLFYAVTHEKKYLDEAERIARASEAHWVKADTGTIADDGAFAHLLSEAFLALHEQDQDPHWAEVVRRALTFVHSHLRDTDGHYSEKWQQQVTDRLDKVSLLSQASVARAFLVASLRVEQK
ncbi:MAG TPA: glycoside hydrolase family 76 protein [Chthonomonadaceae bacterium]|nr:glycoside hydrolase family 76 protein [Chthonomonadaceae bacterium]